MARPRKLLPRYVEHKQSGRARAIYWDASGKRREEMLPGAFGSEESRTAFARFQLEHETAPHTAVVGGLKPTELTLVELLSAYHIYAERHYRHTDEARKGQHHAMPPTCEGTRPSG